MRPPPQAPDRPRPPRILILCALQSETRKVWAAVRGYDVWVRTIGPAGATIEDGRLNSKPDIVIIAGVGGGLDPKLATGSVVIDGCPEGYTPRNAVLGRIHTEPHIVGSPAAKASLFRETKAQVVDMEQAVVIRQLPPGPKVIGVRAVLDTAHDRVPQFVEKLVDAKGRTRPIALVGSVLLRLYEVPALVQLGMRTGKAHQAMAKAAGDLVRFYHGPHPQR